MSPSADFYWSIYRRSQKAPGVPVLEALTEPMYQVFFIVGSHALHIEDLPGWYFKRKHMKLTITNSEIHQTNSSSCCRTSLSVEGFIPAHVDTKLWRKMTT